MRMHTVIVAAIAALAISFLLPIACPAQIQHSYAADDIPNIFTAVNTFTVGLTTGPLTYSQIIALTFVAPGTIITCSNCTTGSNPCTVGSSQVIAVFLNSAWTCSFGGGGSSGGVNPGTANQIAIYLTTGSTVSGDANLTDTGTNLVYTPSGGAILSAVTSPSSTAAMILRSPVPAGGCSPQSTFSLMTVSTDGNWYDSNNGGTCYRHQLQSASGTATNGIVISDANGNTISSASLTSPTTGSLTASANITASDFFIGSGGTASGSWISGGGTTTMTVGSNANSTLGAIQIQPGTGSGFTVLESSSTSTGNTYVFPTSVPATGHLLGCTTTGTTCTFTDEGTGSGGGNPVLENCSPDTTGFVGYSVASLTNYQYGHWEYTFGQSSAIYCTVYIPSAQTGATFVIDIAANDGTAGHTANFQTCDGVVNSGTINIGALTCAANQTFTTTSTAYNRVTLTFNVQSTLANGEILIVKIATSTTGTAPTSDLDVYPHFIL